MSTDFARNLNALAALLLSCVLLGAFGVQFVAGELPCPLCLLQRAAMLGIAAGALLNIRFGPTPAAYGVCLASAVFGAGVSIRQILLHILPGDPGFGEPVLGLHLYTWAFVVFALAAALVSLMLLLRGQFREVPRVRPLNAFQSFAFFVVLTVAAANAVSTVLECGAGICPANPTRYELLDQPGG
jgi:disulfide bond formation protein DsbB